MSTTTSTSDRRKAGFGLLAFAVPTILATTAIGSPGGDYEDRMVTSFIASGHWLPAFVLAYVGAFAAAGLVPAARRLRGDLRSGADSAAGLVLCAAASGVIGWFMVGGVAVAFAEGGSAMRAVPHPVVYLATEVFNLVAIYAPAFLLGLAALIVARQAELPTWLRVLSYVGGVCGILSPLFFTLFVFWAWLVAYGIWALTSSRRTDRAPQPAAVVVA